MPVVIAKISNKIQFSSISYRNKMYNILDSEWKAGASGFTMIVI